MDPQFLASIIQRQHIIEDIVQISSAFFLILSFLLHILCVSSSAFDPSAGMSVVVILVTTQQQHHKNQSGHNIYNEKKK